MDETLKHEELISGADYTKALDTICSHARHKLFIFEKDFVNIGFDSEARYEVLRSFLRENPNNKLHLLAHDASKISQYCPRLMTLMRQFSHNMLIFQTPKHLHRITEAFAVADDTHVVRRFHMDHTKGQLALNDKSNASLMNSRFLEMWEASSPSVSTTTFSL